MTKSRIELLACSMGSPSMLLERSTQMAMFLRMDSSPLLLFGLPPIHLMSSSMGMVSTLRGSSPWKAVMLTTPF